MLARAAKAERSMIGLFSDLPSYLSTILKSKYQPSCRLLCAGHVTPEIEMAADLAEIDLLELIPSSPFNGSVLPVLERIDHPFDIIYLANPNRITGSNCAVDDIEKLVQAVPNGLVIVDEYFFDYFGISATSLLSLYKNIIVLRSFTASFGVYSADSGYAIGSPELIKSVSEIRPQPISPTVRKTIFTVLSNSDVVESRLGEIHEESLRISRELLKSGVQSRITATDFLLIRVASPKDVGNFLAGYKVSVVNLDGYPLMKGYLQYRLQSPLSNDKLIRGFEQMPRQYFSMKSSDRRPVTLLKQEEKVETEGDDPIDKLLNGAVRHRVRTTEVTQ
jgi:histidinol-phosphate/aromatic aminotransferase/cobyric acid decarboxylase-like protein